MNSTETANETTTEQAVETASATHETAAHERSTQEPATHERNVADLFVECLVNEGVHVIYGIPGEENIPLMEALERDGRIRFVLTRHEQGAGFMASTQGHLTGEPGVCLATLGPGALNLTLPVAQANASTTPMVAICAQGNVTRLYKESHQIVDLVSVFRPITQWTSMITIPSAVPEIVRKAFSIAQRKRPGATCLILPEDVAGMPVPAGIGPLPLPHTMHIRPTDDTIARAADIIGRARHPIILAGNGVARAHAENRLLALAEQLNVPVATTFEGKGVISDHIPNALGVVGFMKHDYENFAFDEADLIIAVGFSIQQFDPKKINPDDDKTIIHINTFVEDTDAHYSTALNIMGDIDQTLEALIDRLRVKGIKFDESHPMIHELLDGEFRSYAEDDSFPMKPQRIVYDTRRAISRQVRALGKAAAHRLRHPKGHGRRRYHAGGHRRAEDVDGAFVPDVLFQHVRDRQFPVDDGVDAAGRRCGLAGESGTAGVGRDGRRQLPDERAGNRDRSARRRAHGRARLG